MNLLTRLSLTLTAGFCDTITFIAYEWCLLYIHDRKFIVFAAAISKGLKDGDYIKIINFRVFLTGVVFATFVCSSTTNR